MEGIENNANALLSYLLLRKQISDESENDPTDLALLPPRKNSQLVCSCCLALLFLIYVWLLSVNSSKRQINNSEFTSENSVARN